MDSFAGMLHMVVRMGPHFLEGECGLVFVLGYVHVHSAAMERVHGGILRACRWLKHIERR